MDPKSFVAQTYNVHESQHDRDFIHIGHDPAKRWSAFFNGKEHDLGIVNTLEEAQTAAHNLYDAGQTCALKLEWKLIPETEIKDVTK